jgi:hypothetical protein
MAGVENINKEVVSSRIVVICCTTVHVTHICKSISGISPLPDHSSLSFLTGSVRPHTSGGGWGDWDMIGAASSEIDCVFTPASL